MTAAVVNRGDEEGHRERYYAYSCRYSDASVLPVDLLASSVTVPYLVEP